MGALGGRVATKVRRRGKRTAARAGWEHRPWRRAWRLAVVGVVLRLAGLAWAELDPNPHHHHVLVVLGATLSVLGVVAALRERSSRGRAVDTALEILLATVALGFVVVALGDGASPVEAAAGAALPVLDLALLWLTSRVADHTEACRSSLRWVMAAATIPLLADALAGLSAHGLVAAPDPTLGWLLALGLVVNAVALSVPGRQDPGPTAPVSAVGLQPGDLLAILVPAVLGPLVALWDGAAGLQRTWVGVGGGLVLPLAVVALLLRQVRLRARREYLAHHDPLTGLPNHRLFDDRVEVELARIRRDGAGFTVMFLDLDGFKDVNDSLGHDVGDQLLRGVARRLVDAIREGDTVARVGGDEFTILAPGVSDLAEARRLADEVRQAFVDPVHADRYPLFTDVSIGVVVATDPHTSADELIKQADTAMYQAKSAGRGRVQVWSSELHGRARLRLALENELRRAVERDQLEVHYQPKVRAEDHAVVGYEALVRWNHPRLGQVSPAAFVPLAEAKGLIGSIGRWVLGEACRQAREWVEEGRFRGPIAVNISALELAETRLDELVESALEESGLHPRMLEIELTESALLRDIETTAASIAKVRALGTTVSLDDFGTGYSGLSYLVRIPLDRLKIDRCFVETVRPDAEASPVVEAILGLARGLGLEVVAEGVETEYQAEWLRRRGCDTLQGFLFGEPAPARTSTAPGASTDGDSQRVARALLAVCQSAELDDPDDLVEALAAVGADAETPAHATMRAARRLTLAAMLRAHAQNGT